MIIGFPKQKTVIIDKIFLRQELFTLKNQFI